MAGIVFVRTIDLDRIVAFYKEQLGMDLWLSQPGIEILSHENLLVGFSRALVADVDSLLTFFYPNREDVDRVYRRVAEFATGAPKENERYRIYNFFGEDPDGRRFEVQAFLHPLPEIRPVSRSR